MKGSAYTILLLNIFILFSCNSGQNELRNKSLGVDTASRSQTKGVKDEKMQQIDTNGSFSCQTPDVTSRDTVIIFLPSSYPKSLAIVAPDNTYYILYEPEDRGSDPYVKTDKGKIQINIPTIVKGTVYDNGEKFIRKVFTVTGKYKVVLADNLETELDNTDNLICEINYKK